VTSRLLVMVHLLPEICDLRGRDLKITLQMDSRTDRRTLRMQMPLCGLLVVEASNKEQHAGYDVFVCAVDCMLSARCT